MATCCGICFGSNFGGRIELLCGVGGLITFFREDFFDTAAVFLAVAGLTTTLATTYPLN